MCLGAARERVCVRETAEGYYWSRGSVLWGPGEQKLFISYPFRVCSLCLDMNRAVLSRAVPPIPIAISLKRRRRAESKWVDPDFGAP